MTEVQNDLKGQARQKKIIGFLAELDHSDSSGKSSFFGLFGLYGLFGLMTEANNPLWPL